MRGVVFLTRAVKKKIDKKKEKKVASALLKEVGWHSPYPHLRAMPLVSLFFHSSVRGQH